jgi:uncharacterized metal-binding protein
MASDQIMHRCARCGVRTCSSEARDCFDERDRYAALYEDEQVRALHRAASAVEARHYNEAPRLLEIIHFARELGVKRIGMAFCIGLAEEAAVIDRILRAHFDVTSVCCKITGSPKKALDLERLDETNDAEVMCHPAGQAAMLCDAGAELNVLCGLCVGHDAIFSMVSTVPCVTLIAKDRVLGHSPVHAVYSPYVRKKYFRSELEGPAAGSETDG